MSFDLKTDWIARKTRVQSDVETMAAAGIPLEVAKRLSGWNATFDFDTYEEMQESNRRHQKKG